MHLQYVALVAAAALVAGTHGHEAAPVEGNANRFLTSNDKDLAKVSTGHASLLLQEGGAGRHLRSEADDHEFDNGGPEIDEDRSFLSMFNKDKHKRKHGKKDKHNKKKDKHGHKHRN